MARPHMSKKWCEAPRDCECGAGLWECVSTEQSVIDFWRLNHIIDIPQLQRKNAILVIHEKTSPGGRGCFFMIEHLAGHNSFMPMRVRPGDVDISRGRLVRPQLIITRGCDRTLGQSLTPRVDLVVLPGRNVRPKSLMSRGCGRTHGQSLTPRVGLEVPPDRNVRPKSMMSRGCGRTRDARKDFLEMNEMKIEIFLAHIQ